MKMLPKGSTPPRAINTGGVANQRFSGMSRGIALTRHGSFGVPDQLRPRIVPTTANGSATSSHIRMTERTDVVGTVANEPYAKPTTLRTRAVAKQIAGKRPAVHSIAWIQNLPPLRAYNDPEVYPAMRLVRQ